MNSHFRNISIFVFLSAVSLLCAISARAERERNNIFIFDCTASMKSPNKVWEPARAAFHATVGAQSRVGQSRFVVIPFNDVPYEPISFASSEYQSKKADIDKSFEKYVSSPHRYTVISDALTRAFGLCDDNLENRIYLLTDGKPEGSDSPARVAATIKKWCDNHRNARLFYVVLKPDAMPGDVAAVVDACSDAYAVTCTDNQIPQIADISGTVRANIEELDATHRIDFSNPGEYPVRVSCADTIFNVEAVGGRAADGAVQLKISSRSGASPEELHAALAPLKPHGEPYCFTARVESADPSFFIANPTVEIFMADHIQSRMGWGNQSGRVDEIEAPGADYYPAFWWSDASAPGTFTADLAPAWANVTDPSAAVRMALSRTDDGPTDYRAWFNDRELGPDGTFELRPGQPAVLRVEYAPEAGTGKRYFTLSPRGSCGVDIINGSEAAQPEPVSLRSKYSRS